MSFTEYRNQGDDDLETRLNRADEDNLAAGISVPRIAIRSGSTPYSYSANFTASRQPLY